MNTTTNTLKSIELSLINYKGILDIEIHSAEISYDTQKRKFDLHVKTKASLDRKPKVFFKVDVNPISKNEITSGRLFKLERETVSFYGKTIEEIEQQDHENRQMEVGGIFDTEFFFRNGKLKAMRKDGDQALKKITTTGTFDDDTISCHQRISQMFVG